MKTADVIKQYEEIIRTKKKDIISVAYYQGRVFNWFRKKEKFMKTVSKFNPLSAIITKWSNTLKQFCEIDA